jgi:hypothetical protein
MPCFQGITPTHNTQSPLMIEEKGYHKNITYLCSNLKHTYFWCMFGVSILYILMINDLNWPHLGVHLALPWSQLIHVALSLPKEVWALCWNFKCVTSLQKCANRNSKGLLFLSKYVLDKKLGAVLGGSACSQETIPWWFGQNNLARTWPNVRVTSRI